MYFVVFILGMFVNGNSSKRINNDITEQPAHLEQAACGSGLSANNKRVQDDPGQDEQPQLLSVVMAT